jgi:hypothetical protein
MSTITARYVDTCFPGYLQDGYNRPGQTLLCHTLGEDLASTVEGLMASMDCDAGVPESVSDMEIAIAVRDAIRDVDLRYINDAGDRLDEAPGNALGCGPYLYVVLEWDATVVKVTMEVEVEYYANGTDPHDLKLTMENLVRFAAGNGNLCGSTDAEVKSWGACARVGESLKWVTLRDPDA